MWSAQVRAVLVAQTVCQSSRRVVTELPWPARAHRFPACPAESQHGHCFQISQSEENQRCVEAEDSEIWR